MITAHHRAMTLDQTASPLATTKDRSESIPAHPFRQRATKADLQQGRKSRLGHRRAKIGDHDVPAMRR